MLDSAPFTVRTWKNATCLRDHFARKDFKKLRLFRKSAMKLFIIQCYLYLFHARSRNFAWHLLWLSTTEGTNIVKLLGQLFSTFKFPSNFWKIAPLLGKITNAESLRFLSLSFPSKKSSFMAMNSLWSGGKTFTPCASKTNIRRENWNYSITVFTRG